MQKEPETLQHPQLQLVLLVLSLPYNHVQPFQGSSELHKLYDQQAKQL